MVLSFRDGKLGVETLLLQSQSDSLLHLVIQSVNRTGWGGASWLRNLLRFVVVLVPDVSCEPLIVQLSDQFLSLNRTCWQAAAVMSPALSDHPAVNSVGSASVNTT